MAELDEQYIARMEDVLAMYEKPFSEQEPVVCVDEKPVVLHSDVRPPRPMRPGRVLRRDSEYKREGTANVFCGVEPKRGKHFTKATANRSSPEFADYLVEIVAAYPHADTIHLVMDNLSSHTRTALVQRFGENIGGLLWDRFTVHYTPKHGSWLNQAEIEISLFARQCLGRRRIPSLQQLQREACAWNRNMNCNRVTINWQFTRRKALGSLATKRTSSHGHRPSPLAVPSIGSNRRTHSPSPDRSLKSGSVYERLLSTWPNDGRCALLVNGSGCRRLRRGIQKDLN